MKRIYFDYAASTPVDPAVTAAMRPYFSKIFGNPSALHRFGQEASAAVFKARLGIAKSLGADYREIIFTGSATEANNLALRGAVKSFVYSQATAFRNQNIFAPAAKISSPSARWSRLSSGTKPSVSAGCSSKQSAFVQNFLQPKIIVSTIEHESILETCRDLEKDGIEVVYIPVSKDGIVDLKKIKTALDERTVLVSIMHANNEIGAIQPISAIAEVISNWKLVNRKKIPIFSCQLPVTSYPLFHTDAAQSFQYLDCRPENLGVDLITLSAHKIYGPKGIGVLYARNWQMVNSDSGIKSQRTNYQLPITNYISPIITGSGQEFGLRSGTDNVPYIVGFAKAVELISNSRELENKRVGKLRDYFWRGFKKINSKIAVNGSMKERLPNNLNIYFPGNRAQELLIKLDLAGIAASLGAACSSRVSKTSYVLRAMGFSLDRASSSLRFSLGRQTAKRDIDYTIATLIKFLKIRR